MKKGVYIAFEFPLIQLTEYEQCESGIKKKIYCQFHTFINAGYRMTFLNPYIKRNILQRKIRRRLPFFEFTKWDDDILHSGQLDFIYIRKPWHMDGDLIFHLKKLKRDYPECKVLLEIPTYPYDGEHHALSMKPLIWKDKFWRKYLKKYTDKVITYSDDKEIFGVSTIQISNAINMERIRLANLKPFDSQNIHIMLCATLSYWHGYDRALYGLAEYYKKCGKINFVLHVVGEGDETDHLKQIISDNSLEKHVIMHGKKFGQQLDDIYSLCDLGFDSMGRHRSGVTYNSSLKGKEYAAKGLPIISGVNTEFDYDNSYKYYLRVPADDTPVDYEKVGQFCQHIYGTKAVETIRREIKEYSNLHFTYAATFAPIISYINGE